MLEYILSNSIKIQILVTLENTDIICYTDVGQEDVMIKTAQKNEPPVVAATGGSSSLYGEVNRFRLVVTVISV